MENQVIKILFWRDYGDKLKYSHGQEIPLSSKNKVIEYFAKQNYNVMLLHKDGVCFGMYVDKGRFHQS